MAWVRRRLSGLLRALVRRLEGREPWYDRPRAQQPIAVRNFLEGERLPLKGWWFTVGKIVAGPVPAIILVPEERTEQQRKRAVLRMESLITSRAKAIRDARRAANAQAQRGGRDVDPTPGA